MPDSLNATLQRASDFIARSNYAAAADALSSIFHEDPNNPAALRMLGEAMHHLGEPDKALALLSDSVSAGGVETTTLCRISEILKELNRDHEAADFLIFASELSPKDQTLLSDATSALVRLGRNDEAVALISHASAQSE